MKVAIIGAGFTGLTAAYKLLQNGHSVTIFEKADIPGGLAIGYKKKEWDWSLESYYHHWFTNDKYILQLAKELEYPVLIKRPKTSSYIDNTIYQLDSPLTFLQFPKLTFLERLRMLFVLGLLRIDPFWKPLESVTAAEFLPKSLGKRSYEILWEPLLLNKFGEFAKTISLAWFWARIKKRTSSLAYPMGGFLAFAQTLANTIEKKGGKIIYNAQIEKIMPQENNISLGKNYGVFDKVVVTLPSFNFVKLCPQLPEAYQKKLLSLKGLGAITVILRLKNKFLSDNTYWLNVCDKQAPFLALVEHTNFMESKHYNNEHLVYLGNYLPTNHAYFSLNDKQLLEEFLPYLKKINPDVKNNIIGFDVFKTPFAQPIIPTNYSKNIPQFSTPIPNLYLANMQQVYPWDRGTNYAVELGEKIAAYIQ
ncbi:MAG TPA: NAD(P)/FAD-dependent oxidoreductase [Patescibacteria group bacterium]